MKIFSIVFTILFFSTTTFANECIELVKCAEFVSALTGKKYFYDASFRGNFNKTTNLAFTKENADALFSQALAINGYARIPAAEKDTYKIINARDVRYETLPTLDLNQVAADSIPNNEDYFLAVYKFTHSLHGQMRNAANSLRPFSSRYSRIVDSGNIIMVQEVASKLPMFQTLIKGFDRELTKEEIKRFEEYRKERREERREKRVEITKVEKKPEEKKNNE